MKIKELFKNKLSKKERELIPSAFDVVGSILIFSDFPKELIKKEKMIAEVIIQELKQVTTVCKKTNKYSGKYRTPSLKIIGGDKTKEVLHHENGVRLKLDVEKVYFSPRLATERLRVAKLVKPREDVLVMFSGCAPYPCVIAKNSKAKSIIGVEINPIAHGYGLENLVLNKLDNVGLMKGDAKRVLSTITKKFDRIIMPLPKTAEDFLEIALKHTKKGTIIHFYKFVNEAAINEEKDLIRTLCSLARKSCRIQKVVKCGHFGPGVFRMSFDIKIS